MRRFFITSVILFTLLAALTGCNTFTVRYENFNTAKMPPPFPFKFYLKEVYIGIYSNGNSDLNLRPDSSNDIKKLKSSLLANFPQYFTSEQYGHPECEIMLIGRDGKSPNMVSCGLGLLFLGLPTLGIIPMMEEREFTWELEIKLCGFKLEHQIPCTRGNSCSLGILGAMLQTHRLLGIDGYHDRFFDGIYLDPQSKNLQTMIISAISRLDRDKIIEYHNTRHSDRVRLLE